MAGTVGILRVRNEARWIVRCLTSILPVCERVLVMDDHSDDGTPFICAKMPRVEVFDSPFAGLDECRDKNYLLDKARIHKPDWVLCIDGDEALAHGAEMIEGAIGKLNHCYALPVWFLWDSEHQRRIDGVYGDFHRDGLFRPGEHRFQPTRMGGNFHCGNAPAAVRSGSVRLDAPLLHFGYLHRADRVRKYHWYNQMDPRNEAEDYYRHMVVGDLLPAETQCKHGGPLRVEAI